MTDILPANLLRNSSNARRHADTIEERHDVKIEFVFEDDELNLRMSKEVTVIKGETPIMCCCVQYVAYIELSHYPQTAINCLDSMVADIGRAITYG